MKKFEDVRRDLIMKNLISAKLEKEVCTAGFGSMTNCDVCGVTLMCSIKVQNISTLP